MADEVTPVEPTSDSDKLTEIMAAGIKAHEAFVDNMIALDYAWRTGRLEEYLQTKLKAQTGLEPRETTNDTGADSHGT